MRVNKGYKINDNILNVNKESKLYVRMNKRKMEGSEQKGKGSSIKEK